MRFWFDTEFIEDGRTIDLLSIGIVSEENKGFYAVSREVDLSKANPWVWKNVIPHLDFKLAKTRADIKLGVAQFVGFPEQDELTGDWKDKPEFWGYYADYDWVALCQLFGRMIDLPKGWPMYCRDIKQLCDDLGNPKLPTQKDKEHHAFNDAKWNKNAWHFLQGLKRPK